LAYWPLSQAAETGCSNVCACQLGIEQTPGIVFDWEHDDIPSRITIPVKDII